MINIMNKILPREINNDYQGYKIALYIFYVVTAITLWRSQHHLLSPDGGAESIATIPLRMFTPEGAAAVIGVFSLWGLSQLIIAIIYLIACLRYKSMIPLLYLLMFVEYIIRMLYIGRMKPIPTAGTAPGAIANIIFIIIIPILIFLSVKEKNNPKIN